MIRFLKKRMGRIRGGKLSLLLSGAEI